MIKAKLFTLACLALFLLACGDHLVNEDSPSMEQLVFASASMYNNGETNFYEPISDLYVEQGQSLYFYAGYSIDGKIYTNDSLQQYYNSILWNIGNDAYNLHMFRHTFNTPGKIDGSLETTDSFNDTLRNTFHIYVNTPNSIELKFPYNGYNQAEPTDDQELPLRWNISGIDSWESPRCQVYMAYNADKVWDNLLGNVDCFSETVLSGSLIQGYDSDGKPVNAHDSSFTLYWGIKLLIQSESGRQYRDSTEIFHFSTKILNKKSTIKIPIAYDRYRDKGLLLTKITLVSAKGDTLETLTNESDFNTISAKVEPQTGLTIYLQEMHRLEYTSEVRVVDIPSHTVLTLDTITFKDNTSPQVEPLQEAFDITDSIYFLLYDDGSGVNPSKVHVIQDADTLESSFQLPYLQFRSTCRDICKLQIVGEDFTRNSIPDFYWTIENKRSHFLLRGPFKDEGYLR